MTFFYFKFIVILNFVLIIGCFNSKYCDICANHVLCKYNKSGPSSNCLRYDRSALLSQSDVANLLNRVNEKRNYVAMGLSRNLPQAANMKKILWSEELALFAQRWADQCVQVSFPEVTDACRDLENVKVGQNVATVKGPAPRLNVKAFVDIWFMQALHYNGSTSFYNQARDHSTDSFTQLIWAETDMMGCGKVKFYVKSSKMVLERLICNFAPNGNLHGKPVYIIGIPSTQCPINTVPDDEYDGLCKPTEKSNVQLTSVRAPVTSLLRIINFPNKVSYKETDINQNSKSKENVRLRLQKIRHIFNDTGVTKTLLKYQPTGSEGSGQHIGEQDLSRNNVNKKHNVRRMTKSMNPYPSCRRHNRGPMCTRKQLIARLNEECKSDLITNQCTRIHKTVTPSLYTTNPYPLYPRCTCCNTECQLPTTKCSPYRCGQNVQMFDSRRSEGHPINLYQNILHSTKTNIPPLAVATPHPQNNHFNFHSVRGHFENHSPKTFSNQEEHDSHSDWLTKRRKRKPFEELQPKSFWRIEEYRPKNPPQLKSMKYTTISHRKKIRTWRSTLTPQAPRETEPITLALERMHDEQRVFGTEKYLSFDELMRLRKLEGNDNFMYARRSGNTTAATKVTAETKPTTQTDATTAPAFTTNTPFKRLKHCTRKVTCTWSAATGDDGNDGDGSGGQGKGGGGGKGAHGGGHGGKGWSRTPPGYVDGCTRTFTCTRDYMERNKKATSASGPSETPEDEDYCEKRALNVERRNSDKKYTTYDTYSLLDSFTEDPSLLRTTPVYEYSSQPKQDTYETCYCNQNDARKKRDIEYDFDEGSEINVLKSPLSYADLFYLVIKSIISNAKKSDNLHKKNCLCSSGSKNYIRYQFCLYLLVCHMFNR